MSTIGDYSHINRPRLRNEDGSMSVAEYRRQEKVLETTCRQFEGTMFSKIWKDMIKTAKNPFGEEEKNAFAPLEETVMEMVSEDLSEKQGIGVWKVLYDHLHGQLEVPAEIRTERAAEAEAKRAVMAAKPLRPKVEE